MTSDQRLVHVRKFSSCNVHVQNSSHSIASSHSSTAVAIDEDTEIQENVVIGNFRTGDSQNIISSSHKTLADTRVPKSVAEGIWKKAEMFIIENNAVVVAPGCGPKDRMVKSKSGSTPHLVKTSGNCDYKCDGSCMQFKSLNIYSHIVAAAQVNNDIDGFIQWYRKNFGNRLPNLTQLASHGMPANAGRKGGKAPRKKAAPCPLPTTENRIPLQNIHIVNNSAESQSYCVTQTGNSLVSSYTMPPYLSQPLFPMSPSPMTPLMYSHFPYVSQPYSSNQQPLPFQNPFCAGAAPSTLQTPPQYTALTPVHSAMKKVCFKFGKVSVCFGCHQNFLHSDDLLIRHEEFQSYNSPVTGAPASRFGNAYYHPRLCSLTQKWPEFTSSLLTIPEEIVVQLTSFHKILLYQEFGNDI